MTLKPDETFIIVKKATREVIKSLGKKGETYNKILLRLIEDHKALTLTNDEFDPNLKPPEPFEKKFNKIFDEEVKS